MPITSTHFSNLFFLRNRAKYIVLFLEPFERNFTSLLPLKDWKSGHTLIQNRAMKGNGFDTGLKSQINLHRCFQRTISMPKQSVTSTRYRIHSPSLLGYGSKYDHFSRVSKPIKKGNFNKKLLKTCIFEDIGKCIKWKSVLRRYP